jgi:hypothetical protein
MHPASTRAHSPRASIIDLRPNGPCRPVNWRWQLAERISAKRLVPQEWLDENVIAAATLQRRLASGTAWDTERIERTMPELVQAYQLRFGTATALRLEIEARVLARESLESIARKTSVPPTVLALYQQLFFDVADRLDRASYIMHTAIGERVHGTWTEEDIPTLGWKLFGYHCGPQVLDVLIQGSNLRDRPSSPDEVGSYLSGSFSSQLASMAAVGVHMMDFRDPKKLTQLLRWLTQDRKDKQPKTTLRQVDVEQNLQVFYDEIAVLLKPQAVKPKLAD